MKIQVLKTGSKCRSMSKKVRNIIKNLKIKLKNAIVQFDNLNTKINDLKLLQQEKYDSEGNQVKINIDNVISHRQLKFKQTTDKKQHQLATFNYYAPLDDSPKNSKEKKHQTKNNRGVCTERNKNYNIIITNKDKTTKNINKSVHSKTNTNTRSHTKKVICNHILEQSHNKTLEQKVLFSKQTKINEQKYHKNDNEKGSTVERSEKNYVKYYGNTYNNKLLDNNKPKQHSKMEDNDDYQTFTSLNNYILDIPTTNRNGSGWEVVGEKQKEKLRASIFEEVSTKYLPRYIMPISRTDKQIVKTTKIIPLLIKLRPPAGNKQHPHKSRIIIGVMRALQCLYHDTYLANIHNNHPTTDMICDTNLIPTDEQILENYVTMSCDGKQFIGKIFIHTNNDIIKYKQSPQLRSYLAKEHLVLDENVLTSVRPSNVGFFETTIPRNETIELHTKRLLKKLPKNSPKFQLSISSLYVRSGSRCRIIMMRADSENVTTLQEEMRKLNDKKTLAFFHWGEFLSLTQEQRESIINHQNKWNKNIRSLLLTGFTSNPDSHPMKTIDEEDMDTNTVTSDFLYSTSVTEYFRKYVKTGNGNNLFAYVYPPTCGTYEFLVKAQHESEAKDYLNKAIGELVKRMTPDVIDMTFEDTEAATALIHSTPWKPYSRALMLIPEIMPTGENINENTGTKRVRGQDSYINSTNTYAYKTNNDSNNTTKEYSNDTMDMNKRMEELQQIMEDKLQQQMQTFRNETIQIIDEKNENLKTELTTKVQTSTDSTNMALHNLTTLIAAMQESTLENTRNMNVLMSRIGINNENSPNGNYSNTLRDDSLELIFDTNNTSVIDTPEKQPPRHRYNTRSSGKMDVDSEYQHNNNQANPHNVLTVMNQITK